MLQHSKILKSRDEWKDKAVRRANELRERRKAEKKNKEAISELTKENAKLTRLIEGTKKRLNPAVVTCCQYK